MEKLYQRIIPKAKKPITDKIELTNIIKNLETDNPQIGLDIKVKKDNKFKRIKKKTRNWVRITQINPYWKNFSAIAMLVSALISSGIFLFLFINNFASIPDQVPLIYNQAIHAWTYINRDQALVIPFIHLGLTFVFLRLNLTIFKFDRRLVLTLNNSLILINIIYLFEIFQIFTMLQVY